jgi:hypothetical protein
MPRDKHYPNKERNPKGTIPRPNESNPRNTLDLLIQGHEHKECEARARGRSENEGVTRRHGAQEDRETPDLPMRLTKHDDLRRKASKHPDLHPI